MARDKRGAHLALTLERLEALCDRAADADRAVGHATPDRDRRPAPGRRPARCRRSSTSGTSATSTWPSSCPTGELEAVASAEQIGDVLDRIAALVAPAPHDPGVRQHPAAGRAAGPSARASDSATTWWPPTTAACRRTAATGSRPACGPGTCGRWWPPRRWSSASTSARSSWCARSARRAASPPSCSGSAAPTTAGPARPKGRLYPLTRDELVECAALLVAVRAGRLDAIHPPRLPLDILAQQVVAEVAAKEWRTDELFDLVRRAAPYTDADPSPVRRGRRPGQRRHRDRSGPARRLRPPRRGQRRAAAPARRPAGRGDVRGRHPRDRRLPGRRRTRRHVRRHRQRGLGGRVDGRATSSCSGTHSWQIRRVEPGVVRVRDAGDAPPTVPFWLGEAPARTAELSEEVSALRRARRRAPGSPATPTGPGGGRSTRAGIGADGGDHDRRLPGGRARRPRGHAHPGVSGPRALLRRHRRHAARRPLAVRRAGSTGRSAWRCARSSAGRSTSSCRPPPPTTPWCSRSARTTASRSRRCRATCRARTVERHARARHPGLADVPGPVALEPQPVADGAAVPQRPAQPAADPADGVRRPAWPRCSPRRPPARTTSTGPIEIPDHLLVRQTIDDTLHEALDVDGRPGAARAASRRATSACTAATPPSRRSSPTRSSPPARTPSSTTRSSRTGAPTR